MITEYVTNIGKMGSKYHNKLAYLGEKFVGRVKAKDAGLGKWVKKEKPQSGLCYMNAQKFILMNDDTDLTYHEGYWMWAGGVFPVHHAWLVNAEGKVIDFTAEACDRAMPDRADADKDEYFGMAIPAWLVREQVWKTKQWGDISAPWLEHLEQEKVAA